MYANLKETLAYAKERGIAVGAFNAHCLEMVPAMLHAAKETNLPIIIQTTTGTADYVGYDVFVAVVKTLVSNFLYRLHCILTMQQILRKSNRQSMQAIRL